jgi:uncharacterized membrane protein
MVRTFARDRRGGVAVMAAGSAGLVCALAAAIDVGSVALEARRLQGAADLAALSAVTRLERAHELASATASANAPDIARVDAEVGVYRPDPGLAPHLRFQPGGATPNAVRVTLHKETPLYFSALLLGRQTFTLRRSARAARPHQPRAAFSIGSRVAGLNDGVANALLTGLTGSQISLSLADWQALGSTEVDLLGYWNGLATQAGVDAGRTDSVLESRIDAGRALEPIEGLVDARAGSVVATLSRAMAGRSLTVGDLIALEPGARDVLSEGLAARVSALDLVMAVATVAGGDRQAALDLGASPGLASTKVDLAIGEPPHRTAWLTVTGDGEPVIRTRQVRLLVRAVTSDKLAGLARVELPVLLEAAHSEARLAAIDCPAGTVTIDARPGLARGAIGAIDARHFSDFTRNLTVDRATLLGVAGVVTVEGRSRIEVAQPTFRPLTWSGAEVAGRATKSVSTTSITSSLASSLLGGLELKVSTPGLGVGTGGLQDALGALLTPVAAVLDGLLDPLLDLLGVRLGQADVRLNGLDCSPGGRAGRLASLRHRDQLVRQRRGQVPVRQSPVGHLPAPKGGPRVGADHAVHALGVVAQRRQGPLRAHPLVAADRRLLRPGRDQTRPAGHAVGRQPDGERIGDGVVVGPDDVVVGQGEESGAARALRQQDRSRLGRFGVGRSAAPGQTHAARLPEAPRAPVAFSQRIVEAGRQDHLIAP